LKIKNQKSKFKNWLPTLIGISLLTLSPCSSTHSSNHSAPASRPAAAQPVSISGFITNNVIASDTPIWFSLFVTNITKRGLYVPTHYNSGNYTCQTGNLRMNYHGDDRLATFEDFVLLPPREGMQINFVFPPRTLRPGPGKFSVQVSDYLVPDVRQKLEQTHVPFILALQHEFGQVIVQPLNSMGDTQQLQRSTSQTSP
jgi:hypothetical protein